MKRTLIIILVLALVCALLCGCDRAMRGDGNVGDDDGIITDGDKDRDPVEDGKVDVTPESTVNPTQPITP